MSGCARRGMRRRLCSDRCRKMDAIRIVMRGADEEDESAA